MRTRRVLVGVGIAVLVLLALAIFFGAIMWGRTGYWMGPGMMRGFREPFYGHMYGGVGMMGGLGWIAMLLFWLLVLGGLAVLVIYLVRRGRTSVRQDEMLGPKTETPLDIAKRRYASGEIDGDEFERIKQSLMS
jgi:putative membrane protein